MRRNSGKKKADRSGWGIVALIAVLAIAAGSWLTYRTVQLVRLSRQVDVKVDGSRQYKSGRADAKLLKKYAASQPAALLTGRTQAKKRSVVLLFAGLTDSEESNERILRLLKQAGVKATFALPAARARENDVLLRQLLKNGQQIIGNGITGSEGSEEAAVLLPKLQLAKRTLAAESRQETDLLYLPGQLPQLAKAARTCGYRALVCPENADVFDRQSFHQASEIKNYVQQLSGQRIIVINLASLKQVVHQEPSVKAAKPALDKQARLADQQKKQPAELEIDQVVGLLLKDLDKAGIPCRPLNSLATESVASRLRQQLADDSQQAAVYRYSLTSKRKMALIIAPVHTSRQYRQVRSKLAASRLEASFLVDEQTPEQLIKRIKQDGYDLELTSRSALKSNWAAYQALSKGQQRLAAYSLTPSAYVLTSGDQTSAVRRACWQTDLIPVQPARQLKIRPGGFCLFKPEAAGKMAAFAAKARKKKYQFVSLASLVKHPAIKALSAKDLARLRRQNGGEKRPSLKQVLTTEPALALLFTNLGHSAADLEAGRIVKSRGGQASFAATFDELQSQGMTIERLLAAGNELALVYRPSNAFPANFRGCSQYLNNCLKYCQWRFGYRPKLLVVSAKKPAAGVLEAASAAKLTPIEPQQSLIKAKSQSSSWTTLPKNLRALSKVRFSRGAIEGINLGYYEADQDRQNGSKTVMGQMIKDLLKEKLDAIAYHPYGSRHLAAGSRYQLKTISQLRASKDCYSFNKQKSSLVSAGKQNLSRLQPAWRQLAYVRQHYLGSNFVTSPVKMPGFSYWETSQLDQVGRLTSDRVLFLTFDDWGSDESINKLLYVLKKHQVKATFFVLTENVDKNPNLLRAIAADGHEIASHSDSHVPLATAKNGTYHNLTAKQTGEMKKDLARSYQKLNKYVGNVKVGGKPALSLDFRPPTLEVSKNGLRAVFDVGYKYAISGDVSTNDYEQKNFQQYLNELKYGSGKEGDDFQVTNGSVIVMHMLEDAKYTAQVLDKMIPVWKQEGYRFARVDQYTGNYSRKMKQ